MDVHADEDAELGEDAELVLPLAGTGGGPGERSDAR